MAVAGSCHERLGRRKLRRGRQEIFVFWSEVQDPYDYLDAKDSYLQEAAPLLGNFLRRCSWDLVSQAMNDPS